MALALATAGPEAPGSRWLHSEVQWQFAGLSPSLTPGLRPASLSLGLSGVHSGRGQPEWPDRHLRWGFCAGVSARELELNLRPGQAAALATAGTASGSLWPPVASQWAGPAPAAGPGSLAVAVSGAAVK